MIVLPALTGGQAESWAALIELAPSLGDNWALVGGQMVLLHEVERNSPQTRPTDDLDVVVDLRADPGGLARIHDTLRDAGFHQDQPGPDGMAHRFRRRGAAIDVLAPDDLVAAIVGKAHAFAISSQTKANKQKHLGDFDALLRLLGPDDRATAKLGKSTRVLLGGLSVDKQLSNLGRESLRLLVSTSK